MLSLGLRATEARMCTELCVFEEQAGFREKRNKDRSGVGQQPSASLLL